MGPPDQKDNVTQDCLHRELMDAGVTSTARASHDRIPANQRCDWYRTQYAKHFDLRSRDFLFLDVLADLFLEGEVNYTTEDGCSHYRTILEGHSWLVEYIEPNLTALKKAGLLRYPKINGEERKRLNHRTFYELTPSAKHIINNDWSGEGIGEEGEGIVHRLGVWITYFWLSEKYCNHEHGDPHSAGLLVNRYPSFQGTELDLTVEYFGLTGTVENSIWDRPKTIVEIESDSKHLEDSERDAYKMGHVCRDTVWVFPTRSVLADVVNEMLIRGFASNMDFTSLIPETLPLRGHRDTWNKRLETAETNREKVDFFPIRRVYTYQGLADELRNEMCPELFFDTSSGYWSDKLKR